MEFPQEEFLKPEIRCDHQVTEKVKKLWYVQLACYQELVRVCEKYGIKYFASGGTLLGCIRHGGFIPWDDDMDICMLPDDYLRFCEVAPKEIKEPFFFQNYMTNEGYGPCMSRIRHSETTACTQFEYDGVTEGYHLGIFIDIFPLAYLPDSERLRKKHRRKVEFYRAGIAGYEIRRKLKRNHQWNVRNVLARDQLIPILTWEILHLFMDHRQLSKRFLDACFSVKYGSQVGVIPFMGYHPKTTWSSSWFEETIEKPFEYVTMVCPKAYDEVLTQQYGDWHQFIKGTAIHSMPVFDPDRPYTEVMKKVIQRSS